MTDDKSAPVVAEVRRAPEDVLSSPMATALLTALKTECEQQHARAEKAEAEVARLTAALGDTKESLLRAYRNNGDAYDARDKAESALEALRTRLRGLEQQWRDHAGRVRPLESAPITSEKRERIAEWMWYSNRANELAALLTTPEEP